LQHDENQPGGDAAPARQPTRQLIRHELTAFYASQGVRKGRSYSTLCKLGASGEGPPFKVIGGLAHYDEKDVVADADALKRSARRG
jgi:hypothetical protein